MSSHVVVCTIKCRVSGLECHGDGARGQDRLLLIMLRKQVNRLNQSVLEYVILCLGVCNSCVYLFVFNISENVTNRGHFLSDTKQRNEEIYLRFKHVSDSEHVSPDMQLFVFEKTQGACSLQPTVMQSLISPMLKNGQAIPFPSYSASIKLTVHLMYVPGCAVVKTPHVHLATPLWVKY